MLTKHNGELSDTFLLGSALVGVASLVVRWRRSYGDARQQLKWFAYFLGTAVTFQLLLEAYGAAFKPDVTGTWFESFYLALNWVVWLGFPTVVGLTVFKYRLYDIDVIINRTLVYSGLTGTLAVVYFGSVVLLQRLLPVQSQLAIVISTLVIAALFTPLRRRIQNDIDRRFYRRKYDAQQVLAAFAETARDETDLDQLTEELVRVVEETMQPAHVSLWLRDVPGGSAQRRGEGRGLNKQVLGIRYWAPVTTQPTLPQVVRNRFLEFKWQIEAHFRRKECSNLREGEQLRAPLICQLFRDL